MINLIALSESVDTTLQNVGDQADKIENFILNNDFILAVVVVIVALIFSRFLEKLVYRTVIFFSTDKNRSRTNKVLRSYCNLLATVLRYLVYAFTFFVILSIYNVPIMSMLTSLGFIGVMITYIFQNMIQDITNGFFIVFESPFEVGDRVKINNYVGKVVEIKSRYVILIDAQNNRYIINNRVIDSVVVLNRNIEFVR